MSSKTGEEIAEPVSVTRNVETTKVDMPPTSASAPAQPAPVSFSSLVRYATRREVFLNILGLFAAMAVGTAQPLLSLVFSRLANSFVEFGITAAPIQAGTATPEQQAAFDTARDHFRSQASTDALYLVYICIAAMVLSYAYMLIWTINGEKISRRIREKYFEAVLRQDIAYFDDLGAGAVATRITTDTLLIQTGISEKVALVTQYLTAFVAAFIIAYVRSWRLALPMTVVIPCVMLAGAVMGRAVAKFRNQGLRHISEGGSFAEEVFSTIRTSKAFGTQSRLSAVYATFMTAAYKLDRKGAWYQAVGLGWFFFVIYCSYALAFDYGTTLLLQGHGNVGTIVNVFMAIIYGSLSLMFVAPEMTAINTARGAAAKIFETIDRTPPIDSSSPAGLRPSSVTGAITLSNLSLIYPSRPTVPVLRDLSLSFAPGQTSALVGASGCGKSSIVSLIERFYDPTSGSVTLDGVDLKELNVKWLRGQIGLVGQEPVLFSTTIRQNVLFGLAGTMQEGGREEEKQALVEAACRKANAHEFVSKLPEGYDTRVGERGFLLSGGQKQRIAIARAIVGDPAILLLDEATSALDTHSEGIVQDALNKASEGRTVIAIAHRLSTIKHAHCIYVMSEGQLVEQGSHAELLEKKDGAYAQLVTGQQLREAQTKLRSDDLSLLESSVVGDRENAGISSEAPKDIDAQSIDSLDVEAQKGASLAVDVAPKAKEHEYDGFEMFLRMAKINKDATRTYALGVAAAITCGIVFPVFAIVYGIVIQGFQTTDRSSLRTNGNHAALYFFIIALVQSFSTFVQNATFQAGASSLTWKLRQMCFRAIMGQDVGWFDEEAHAAGILVSNLADSPFKFFGLAGATLGSIFSSFTTLFGGWIVALIYCWRVALVGMSTSPFLFSMGYLRLRVVGLKDQRNKKSHASSARVACEAADSIKTVASFTLEDAFYSSYSISLDEPSRVSRRTILWSALVFAFVQGFLYASMALVFWYGSRLVSNLEASTQHYFTAMMSVTFGSMQAGNAFNFVPDISSAKGAAADMLRLMDGKPVIERTSDSSMSPIASATPRCEGEKEKVEKATMGRVELKAVRFTYPTRPHVPVLRGLDLVAEPGQYVAIVGPSGSGKSTVVQMIERFYAPSSGQVFLDDIDIASVPIQKYRSNLALVSQEPSLYAGTIRFNILLGSVSATVSEADGSYEGEIEASQEEIDQACRDANIYDFIQSLPDGYETQVGGKGAQLSGGQKQRIAIARALLRNPKVLLLDEATSALDSTSEKVVQQALDNAAKGRTTISIAHRLSTIQNADRIYYLKDGLVVEFGTHDELLELKGGYYELVQLQALGKEA